MSPFRWKPGRSPGETIGVKVGRMINSLEESVNAELQPMADKVLAWARANHPWNNITGEAERGLAIVWGGYISGAGFRLVHGVFYGIFLELANAGRWGVIRPAMAYARTLILPSMTNAIRRVFDA